MPYAYSMRTIKKKDGTPTNFKYDTKGRVYYDKGSVRKVGRVNAKGKLTITMKKPDVEILAQLHELLEPREENKKEQEK